MPDMRSAEAPAFCRYGEVIEWQLLLEWGFLGSMMLWPSRNVDSIEGKGLRPGHRLEAAYRRAGFLAPCLPTKIDKLLLVFEWRPAMATED
jgi:hypothetical protein